MIGNRFSPFVNKSKINGVFHLSGKTAYVSENLKVLLKVFAHSTCCKLQHMITYFKTTKTCNSVCQSFVCSCRKCWRIYVIVVQVGNRTKHLRYLTGLPSQCHCKLKRYFEPMKLALPRHFSLKYLCQAARASGRVCLYSGCRFRLILRFWYMIFFWNFSGSVGSFFVFQCWIFNNMVCIDWRYQRGNQRP